MRAALNGWWLVAAAIWGLSACGGKEQAAIEVLSRPVKTVTVAGGASDAIRTFPGRIDAAQRAELGFRVPGQVQEILVKEGDEVEEGQILASLDPTDYEIVYEDRKASFDNSKANYERGKELVVDGNISRMDFDRMEANYRSATAALSQAEKDLEYTVLTSPFAGRVAERLVESFEEVLAKQTVFRLQNTNELDVVIDLPESILRLVRARSSEERAEGGGTIAFASFEGRSGERFPLRPKELATKADEQTQTFRATFTMLAPTTFTVLPGMTTNVALDLTDVLQREVIKQVPVRAVQADSGLEPRVWIVDPATMTVSSREVSIGRMVGRNIQVTSGLEGGEEIVAVGAPYLSEGMKVTRMRQTEQAELRVDDPL